MKMKISVSPATLILTVCMIATTPMRQFLACMIAAGIHELGHILAAKVLSINLSHMKLDVIGARLTTSGQLCSYPSMIGLCLAGPFINILCFALSYPFCDTSPFLREFCLSSLSLAMLNLIPIEGFDGGRILHGFLNLFLPLHYVERVCSILSFLSLFCMWLLSVWLLLKTGNSLTLFVFSCCLFGMLFV